MQCLRPAPNMQPAWERPLLANAARDTGLHGCPNGPQRLLDLVLTTPGLLVLEHHARNTECMRIRVDQKFLPATEWIGQWSPVCNYSILGRLVVIDDKTAPYGIIVACCN